MTSELHPLEPFLPVRARLLMLGSFPPQRVRWSMDFLPELAERYVAYRRTGIFRGQGVFSDTRRETFRQGTDRAFLRGERIGSLRYGRRDNPIEKQCFRQFSSSSARGRSGAVVGCGSDLPGDRDDGTEGYRCDRAPYRLRRAACGRSVEFAYADRMLRFYRMPSSSRAYPKPVEWKADYYRRMFAACGML